MKPWQQVDPPSDFARSDARAADQTVRTPRSHASTLAGVGAATFALGFVEACLHVDRRPIPLPFATRFALYNVLPSAVWSTVSAPHIAAASNLPLERLVVPATFPHGPKLEGRRANRLIAIKTVRSLRHAVASYGIVWSVWRWREAQQSRAEGGGRPLAPEDSARAPTTAGCTESVVRLAPVGSSLSKATLTKHGDHVRHVPWRAVHRGDAIDWSTVGLEVATGRDALALENSSETSAPLLKVLELEINSEQSGANAFQVAKRAAAGANGPVRTVAVVDQAASPEWHARSNGVDVYFFAVSGIVEFLREHLEDEASVVLVGAVEGDTDDAFEQEKTVLHIVRHALVHRHGAAAFIGIRHALQDEEDEDDVDSDLAATAPPALTVVFSPTFEAAVKQLARIAGLVPIDRTLVVVDESLHAKSSFPHVLAKCAGVLSVADLTDSVLQRIREQLRAGVAPETIQLGIFEEFGEQSALLCRVDGASDIAKYI